MIRSNETKYFRLFFVAISKLYSLDKLYNKQTAICKLCSVSEITNWSSANIRTGIISVNLQGFHAISRRLLQCRLKVERSLHYNITRTNEGRDSYIYLLWTYYIVLSSFYGTSYCERDIWVSECQIYAVVCSDIVRDVLKFFGSAVVSFAFGNFHSRDFYAVRTWYRLNVIGGSEIYLKREMVYCHAAVCSELTQI